jgi:D-lactate dehydrogenase (cytochrome)
MFLITNMLKRSRILSSRTGIIPRSTSRFLSIESSSHSFIQSLEDVLPSHVEISTNSYDLMTHGKGESYHPTAPPAAVVSPTCIEDVVAIVRHCSLHKIPIIPFGAGTSVEGHLAALHGGISMDMCKFDTIEFEDNEESLPDAIVCVGAGVTRKRLNEELRHSGMEFVVDPGADATIGGMVACGASGTTAVKYGTMRENILGLTCVLPDGTVAKCGTRAPKSSAGYDLTSLMTGSEGTLGIITHVTCKLHPIPQHVIAAVCSFENLHQAAEAVATLKLCGVPVARCELLDEASVGAFNAYNASRNESGKIKPVEVKPTLFLEFQGASTAAVEEQAAMTESICLGDYGGTNFRYTSDEAERKELWSARHNLYYASLALRPGSESAILTDACVPLSKFAELVSATAQDVKDLGVVGPCFGHAGDGNFHCILPVTKDDSQKYLSKLHKVNDNLIRRTLQVGGTCTGEHGVGYGKMNYLQQQYGPGGVHMMRMIKQGLDPQNIMNPGKVVS